MKLNELNPLLVRIRTVHAPAVVSRLVRGKTAGRWH